MGASPTATPPLLEVRDLLVTYGATVAVDHVDLAVARGEVVTLLGPSGCGKSSLLRAVAGLEPAAGTIRLDGRDLTGVPPHRRGVGLMFQGEALFPHRDVGANVGFGLRMQDRPRPEVEAGVAEALALVGLPGTQRRSVDELSGGEQQRVALARAIAPRPHLLMLDEPMSSVDRALRDRLLEDLPRVFAEVDAAVLHVTHDQDEALALADRVAVMRAGRIVQIDTPRSVWQSPVSAFVARFLGVRTILDADVHDGVAHTSLARVPAPGRADGPASVIVPPEALAPGRDPGGHTVPLRATVTARRFAGDHAVVVATLPDGTTLEVAWRDGAWPTVGDRVDLAVDPERLRVVERD